MYSSVRQSHPRALAWGPRALAAGLPQTPELGFGAAGALRLVYREEEEEEEEEEEFIQHTLGARFLTRAGGEGGGSRAS